MDVDSFRPGGPYGPAIRCEQCGSVATTHLVRIAEETRTLMLCSTCEHIQTKRLRPLHRGRRAPGRV